MTASSSSYSEWQRDAKRHPFVSLDIESDGAQIRQIAILPSDATAPYVAIDGPISADHLQTHLDRLLPGRTLTGHNVRAWDCAIIERHGARIPEDVPIWDTLEREIALCKHRNRASYALRTEHDAKSDAQIVLDLAQNQWLRWYAPWPVAQQAWEESDRFFLAVEPRWRESASASGVPAASWEELQREYQLLGERPIRKEIARVEWRVFTPPRGEGSRDLFNPASPKRIDYWHRLLPAIQAAHRETGRTVLFVQHEHEIDCLFNLWSDAIKGDPRRGARTLARRGGLLLLHESLWRRTLAEGLPPHTTLLLEKMPEADSVADRIDLECETVEDEEEIDGEAEDAGPDADEFASALPLRPRERRAPDLHELGKMTLWQKSGTDLRFACLDARLWNLRTETPFRCTPLAVAWRAAGARETVERAGFRQTTEEFHLSPCWEQDVCRLFGVDSLHRFQQASLARILPRDGLGCVYVERATGGGKSLIFQAAALYRGETTGRLTVVISPLRALIHDQVSKLHSRGFALDVEALSGDMGRGDVVEAYRRIAGGEAKLVYTAPERFRSNGFLRALETRLSLDAGEQPEFWVFDEAHCISLWGLEFRPDYRKAAAYIREQRKRSNGSAAPVLLVSATLTRLAKDDIETLLGVK